MKKDLTRQLHKLAARLDIQVPESVKELQFLLNIQSPFTLATAHPAMGSRCSPRFPNTTRKRRWKEFAVFQISWRKECSKTATKLLAGCNLLSGWKQILEDTNVFWN